MQFFAHDINYFLLNNVSIFAEQITNIDLDDCVINDRLRFLCLYYRQVQLGEDIIAYLDIPNVLYYFNFNKFDLVLKKYATASSLLRNKVVTLLGDIQQYDDLSLDHINEELLNCLMQDAKICDSLKDGIRRKLFEVGLQNKIYDYSSLFTTSRRIHKELQIRQSLSHEKSLTTTKADREIY